MEIGPNRELVLRIGPRYRESVKISCAHAEIVGESEIDTAAGQQVGFGRATILEAEAGRLLLQLKTSRGGERRSLPKGTRVFFVSDSPDNPFNGLWSTTILSTKLVAGKTALECARPKFEAVVQSHGHGTTTPPSWMTVVSG